MFSDDELLEALKNKGRLPIPYFDGTELEIKLDKLSPMRALTPLKSFLSQTGKDRIDHSRHLFAYYQVMKEACGDEVISEGLPIPRAPEEIWKNVQPSRIYFNMLDYEPYVDKPTVFVMLSGNVDWEPEHGLLMCWREGKELNKVGPFDGHATNGHATANVKNDRYIHYCYDDTYSTLPD